MKRIFCSLTALCMAVCMTVPALGVNTAVYSSVSAGVSASLGQISSVASAVNAVHQQLEIWTEDGTTGTAPGVDTVIRYGEAAIERAARTEFNGATLVISRDSVAQLLEDAKNARDGEKDLFDEFDVDMIRDIKLSVCFSTFSEINIQLEPDILDFAYMEPGERLDRIVVDTACYQLVICPAELLSDFPSNGKPLMVGLKVIPSAGGNQVEMTLKDMSGNEISSLAGHLGLTVKPDGNSYSSVPKVVFRQAEDGELERVNYNFVYTTGMAEGVVSRSGVYASSDQRRPSFSDVDSSDITESMREAIDSLYSKNVVDGREDNTFGPNDSISRGAFVKMLMTGLGNVDKGLRSPFTDIQATDYYYYHAATASARNYVGGYTSTYFGGRDTINRNQVCLILARVMRNRASYRLGTSVDEQLSKFKSLSLTQNGSASTEVKEAVALLIEHGVIPLDQNGNYTPDRAGRYTGTEAATRGEVAELMNNMLKCPGMS